MSPGFSKFVSEHPEVRMLTPGKAVAAYLSYTKQAPGERQAVEQAGVALQGLDDLLRTGQKVLPTAPGVGALMMRGQRWYQMEAGDPAVTQFNSAKTVLINHLRAVAGVSRVNQQELMMASEAIQNAGTYPALQAAVKEAKKRLAESKREIESRTTEYGIDLGDGDQGGGDKTSDEVNDFFSEHGGSGDND